MFKKMKDVVVGTTKKGKAIRALSVATVALGIGLGAQEGVQTAASNAATASKEAAVSAYDSVMGKGDVPVLVAPPAVSEAAPSVTE